MSHRFTLLPYKTPASRKTCPSCGAKHEFAPYIDNETGELLPDHVGRCNRELHCGYHYTPKQYFADKKENTSFHLTSKPKAEIEKPISYIPFDYIEKSTRGYSANNFFLFLANRFTKPIAVELCAKYFVGTSKHWDGANIFWQIDIEGNVRAGKIMHYEAITGKRTREPYDRITWVHSVLKLPEFNLKQCFFGEHLLTEFPDKSVCIVESEKTAIICSLFFPKFNWLATGGKNGCRWLEYSVNKVLRNKRVILYPDANSYDAWKERASKLFDFDIMVSDYLETMTTDEQRATGIDIADILLGSGANGAAPVQPALNLHHPAPVQSAGGI
jgi:hypothetical protein